MSDRARRLLLDGRVRPLQPGEMRAYRVLDRREAHIVILSPTLRLCTCLNAMTGGACTHLDAAAMFWTATGEDRRAFDDALRRELDRERELADALFNDLTGGERDDTD